jgi:WD40 repeat protein/serine/threonine protein kinase
MNDVEEAIFHTASQIEAPQARAAFLDRACGAEGEMRVRIEARLEDVRTGKSLASGPRDDSGSTSEPSAPLAPSTEGPGTWIGRYKLLEKIGEGGMGSVYIAEQEEPVKRQVALKIIKLGMDTRQVIARFEAERQALAMMDNPHIARVFDAGATLTGRPYFVMELLRGERITTYCDKNNLTVPQRLELFIQVCEAVQHAHQKGIIHRDLKPSNILVALSDGNAVVKVIDFGIAKAVEQPLTDKTLFTEIERQVGTPAYMSPEQVSLTGKDTDTRSDIYSLGVLLYELLTGSPPFDPFLLSANGAESIRRTVCEVEPVRPSTRVGGLRGDAARQAARQRGASLMNLRKAIKGDLDWIVMKCLEKDRGRRYDTANGLGMDIERYLANEPVVAGPPSANYRVRKFIIRNKGAVILGTTVVALTLAGLVGTSVGMRRATVARKLADQNADEARKLEITARVGRSNALRQVYSASMLSASDALERAEIESARHYLESAPPELRGWEWLHLASRLNLTTIVQDQPRTELSEVHVLPDGRSYYVVGDTPSPGVRQYDMESGRLLAEIPTGRYCDRSWLNPSAKQIVLSARDTPTSPQSFETWDMEHGVLLFKHPSPKRDTLYWVAPDGSRVAYESAQKIYIFDTRSGTSRGSATNVITAENQEEPIGFSPDARRLALCKRSGEVALLDADSITVLKTFKAHDHIIGATAFSPDSHLLATGSKDIRITDVSADPPALVSTLRGHSALVTALCFSPDGSMLASCGLDRTLRLWETRTGTARGIFESDSLIPHPSFLPSGKTLINCDLKGVQFWDVDSSSAWVLRGHHGMVYPVLLSPDGGTIYSGGWDGFLGQPGCLRFWDAASGNLIAATGAAEEYVRAADLSRDGSRLAISVTSATGKPSRIDILDAATGALVVSITQQSGDKPLGIDSIVLDPRAENVFWIETAKGIAHLASARTGALGKSTRVFGGDGLCFHAAWSPDGSLIALNNRWGPTIDLLDAQSLELVRRWPHGYNGVINSLSFSPDGRRILTPSSAGIVAVWDTATGKPVHELVGHGNDVLCAAYSPDGKRIASGGRDDNVRIWDAEAFDQLARLSGHEDYVFSLAWATNSQKLISGSGDHTIRIWDTTQMKDRVRARRERQDLVPQLESKVRQLFADLSDANKVVENVKSDQSLTARERQVALQIVLQISLAHLNAAHATVSGPRPWSDPNG